MNEIKLKGFLRNIEYSHSINTTDYYKADLIVPRNDGKEDVLNLRFKQFANPYENNQEIELRGNVRSFSQVVEDGKNKVTIYVFTYFDIPEVDSNDSDVINEFELDGRICKIDDLRITKSGKESIHFILANNIISKERNQKLNNYIPMTAWGNCAKEIEKLHISDKIKVKGQLHSRTYKKILPDGELEFRTAHEGVVTEFEVL